MQNWIRSCFLTQILVWFAACVSMPVTKCQVVWGHTIRWQKQLIDTLIKGAFCDGTPGVPLMSGWNWNVLVHHRSTVLRQLKIIGYGKQNWLAGTIKSHKKHTADSVYWIIFFSSSVLMVCIDSADSAIGAGSFLLIKEAADRLPTTKRQACHHWLSSFLFYSFKCSIEGLPIPKTYDTFEALLFSGESFLSFCQIVKGICNQTRWRTMFLSFQERCIEIQPLLNSKCWVYTEGKNEPRTVRREGQGW